MKTGKRCEPGEVFIWAEPEHGFSGYQLHAEIQGFPGPNDVGDSIEINIYHGRQKFTVPMVIIEFTTDPQPHYRAVQIGTMKQEQIKMALQKGIMEASVAPGSI